LKSISTATETIVSPTVKSEEKGKKNREMVKVRILHSRVSRKMKPNIPFSKPHLTKKQNTDGKDIMLKSVLQLRLVSLTEKNKNFSLRFSGANIRVREGLRVLKRRTRAPGRRSQPQRGSSTD
jgi:hypothetical protein